MKKTLLPLCLGIVLFGSVAATSCKDKPKEETTTTETTIPVQEAPPVEIATDDQLATNVQDAIKDFPGVQATVLNGEITLTGTIKRDRLQQLMAILNNLQPKKINNNLTIQD